MRLLLIRHPESAANARGLFYGRTDWPYSERGAETAGIIAGYVERHWADEASPGIRVYSSPLKRAYVLARQIAQSFSVEAELADDLIDMNVGIFENLNDEQLTNQYRDEWEAFKAHFTDYEIPQGESARMVHERVGAWINTIKDSDGMAIVVTHSVVIRSLLAYVLNIDFGTAWHFKIDPGCLAELDYENGHGVLRNFVQVNHMRD